MATITVQELSAELDTDPRTARRFLRSITPKDSQPGKGSRWAIEKREVRGMRKKFTAFIDAENAKKAARAENDAKNELPPLDEDVTDRTDFADENPSDAELDAIEND